MRTHENPEAADRIDRTPTHECTTCSVRGSYTGVKNHMGKRHNLKGKEPLSIQGRGGHLTAPISPNPQEGNQVACNACRLPEWYKRHTCGL